MNTRTLYTISITDKRDNIRALPVTHLSEQEFERLKSYYEDKDQFVELINEDREVDKNFVLVTSKYTFTNGAISIYLTIINLLEKRV